MTVFEGRIAIVTGAARGLGLEYARALAADGAAVILADIDAEGATRAAKELAGTGARALGVGLDVTDAASADAMVETATRELGGVDILINNAALWGDLEQGDLGILDNDVETVRRVLDVNFVGTFVCSKAVVGAMRARGGGRIVNISSIGAWMPGGPYGVSKLAVNQLTYAAAQQLAADGITVNAVAPGMIDNEATLRQIGAERFQMMMQAMVPAGRGGSAQDMYSAIRWLCSADAGYVTGQVISPNGGSHARF